MLCENIKRLASEVEYEIQKGLTEPAQFIQDTLNERRCDEERNRLGL
jgi:hypothetical protein